jgi:hypothetical protein
VVVDGVTLNGGEESDRGSGLTAAGELSISLTARIFSQSTLDAVPGATGGPPAEGGATGSGGSQEVVN